jgi:hypothetical protein
VVVSLDGVGVTAFVAEFPQADTKNAAKAGRASLATALILRS